MNLGEFLATLSQFNKNLNPDDMMLNSTKIDITRKQIAIYEKRIWRESWRWNLQDCLSLKVEVFYMATYINLFLIQNYE